VCLCFGNLVWLLQRICAERISSDMALDEELADTVLTHVGGCSLFIEHDMTTQYTPVLRNLWYKQTI
jgi:hypothetical protein